MALRPGSYNAASPDWRGVIRQDGLGWYHCTHRDHRSQREATACARQAFPAIRDRDPEDPEARLPEGWTIFYRR